MASDKAWRAVAVQLVKETTADHETIDKLNARVILLEARVMAAEVALADAPRSIAASSTT